MTGLLKCLLMLAVASPSLSYNSQRLLLRLDDRIVLINEQPGECKTVFNSEPFSYLIEKTRLSASGRYMTTVVLDGNSDLDSCSNGEEPEIGLLVIDMEKETKRFICNVQTYAWSPNEDKLVYILYGKDNDDREEDAGDAFFSGESIWLYDAQAKISIELKVESNALQSLGWSEHDGNIYALNDEGVIRYTLNTGLVVQTKYLGVHLSPDGKYCFRESVDSPCGLYLSESQTAIPFIEESSKEPIHIYSDFVSWGVLGGETVLFLIDDGLSYIVCATGRMHKVVPPSPDIDPIGDLVGFREGRPVWAKIKGDKAELFYY